MLIIKFYQKRYTDTSQVPFDTGYFAVDAEGRIAMKEDGPALPDPVSFTDDLKLVGLAPLKTKKLTYGFEDITPELSGIHGLSSKSDFMPSWTVIVEDLDRKIAWSRGIEKIYFV